MIRWPTRIGVRVRGAVVLALLWAIGWAVAGVLIGVSSVLLPWLPWDAFFAVFDAPLPALALPGFVGGALFSVVLGIAERQRRFEELSVHRVAAWGALGGLLLSMIPATALLTGVTTIADGAHRLWPLIAIIAVPFILLSVASAAGSLLLARRGGPTSPIDVGGADGEIVADLWLDERAANDLLASLDRPCG